MGNSNQILVLIFLVYTTITVFSSVSGDNFNETANINSKVPEENSTTDPQGTPTESEVDGNDTLLQSNDPKNVGFYLYSDKDNLTNAEVITLGDSESLKNSTYNPQNPPVFLIHGFLNNYTTRFSQRVKNALLSEGYSKEYNIIVVDWGMLASPANLTAWSVTHINDLSRDLFYQAAVNNVPKVGNRISEFLLFLNDEEYLTSPSEVRLIGFSLGGQISGFAGYFFKQNTSSLIGRITGLDPAGPLYQTEISNDKKLDSSDGAFVDIVHSNHGQDGYYGNIGHADFYPNGGGPNQPDCIEVAIGTIPDTVTGTCAHNRAWIYYIKALSTPVAACKCLTNADVLCKTFCTNKVLFGFNCPTSARGSYYFDIAVKEP